MQKIQIWLFLTKNYLKRLYNHFIRRKRLSAKGAELLQYCSNILTNAEENNVQDYSAQMFEQTLDNVMSQYNVTRETAAAMIVSGLLQY